MLSSGKGVLEQVVHRMAEYKKYALPEDNYEENFERTLQAVQRNGGDLELPACLLLKVDIKPNSGTAVYQGFRVTTRFVMDQFRGVFHGVSFQTVQFRWFSKNYLYVTLFFQIPEQCGSCVGSR